MNSILFTVNPVPEYDVLCLYATKQDKAEDGILEGQKTYGSALKSTRGIQKSEHGQKDGDHFNLYIMKHVLTSTMLGREKSILNQERAGSILKRD